MSNEQASEAGPDAQPEPRGGARGRMKAGSRSGSGAASVIEHLGEKVRMADGGPVLPVEEPPQPKG